MTIRKSALVGAALLLGSLAPLSGTASAAPANAGLNVLGATAADTAIAAQEVRHRNYSRRHHGPRYRYRRHGYNHFHNGFWYAMPFWLGTQHYYAPRYGYGYGYRSRGRAHVEWCDRRYRSYNPRTDTFRGYDGRDHRCYSPYS